MWLFKQYLILDIASAIQPNLPQDFSNDQFTIPNYSYNYQMPYPNTISSRQLQKITIVLCVMNTQRQYNGIVLSHHEAQGTLKKMFCTPQSSTPKWDVRCTSAPPTSQA
jgi:hypothetical protein